MVCPAHSRLKVHGAEVRVQLWSSDTAGGVYTPRAFLSCIGGWDRRFSGGQQHDSQEFLHSLLDALQVWQGLALSFCPNRTPNQ